MSADVLQFKEWAGSGRGLTARPVMPNRLPAYAADIAAVSYQVQNITDGGAPISGSLVVADVLETSLQPWDVDNVGYTFNWEAPGTLWPTAGKVYRIVVSLQTTPALGNLIFYLTWQVETYNVLGT